MKRVEIPFGENKIVAEVYDRDCPVFPAEISIHLQDKDNVVLQDICLVRPHYSFEQTGETPKIYNDLVDCLVWGDANNEDYTKKYVIDVYEEEE